MNLTDLPHDSLATWVSDMAADTTRLTTANVETQALIRKRLQENAKRVLSVTQSPMETVFQHAFSGPDKACVRIAVDLHIFHTLTASSAESSSPVSLATLASDCGADQAFLRRIMRILCATSFCTEAGADLYEPSAITKAMTLPPLESAVRHAFDHALQVLVKIPHFFAQHGYTNPAEPRGGPFQAALHTDLGFFEYLEADPQANKDFDTFMESSRGRKAFWADWFPAHDRLIHDAHDRTPFMVDVGGGRGQDLRSFRARFPACGRLVLQDLPRTVQQLGQTAEFEIVAHDFFQPQPVKGARVYFFHYITHNWPDAYVRKVLKQTAEAMKPGYSKLILNEYILPAVGCPLMPGNADFVMMADLAGQERTEAQFKALLDSVGLTVAEFWYPPGELDGVVEAMKPV